MLKNRNQSILKQFQRSMTTLYSDLIQSKLLYTAEYMSTLPHFLSLAEEVCDRAVAQNKTYGHFSCDSAVLLR